MQRRIGRLAASGFGTGFAPVAPGTVGALLAVIIGGVLLTLPLPVLLLAIAAATLLGFWAIGETGIGADDDPGWVVIDEIAGQFVALLGLGHPSVAGLIAAFLLFRLFDIVKPGPIGWADRQHGATGIMLDDLLAGALAALILFMVRYFWPGGIG